MNRRTADNFVFFKQTSCTCVARFTQSRRIAPRTQLLGTDVGTVRLSHSFRAQTGRRIQRRKSPNEQQFGCPCAPTARRVPTSLERTLSRFIAAAVPECVSSAGAATSASVRSQSHLRRGSVSSNRPTTSERALRLTRSGRGRRGCLCAAGSAGFGVAFRLPRCRRRRARWPVVRCPSRSACRA